MRLLKSCTMKSCFETLAYHADRFSEILAENAQEESVPEFPWRNRIWTSQRFRRAHVEEFSNEQISVLHVTVFPHLTDPAPIFGFDVITGVKRPVGCYADLSPSIEVWQGWRDWLPVELARERAIPDWGTCFSQEFITTPLRDQAHLEYMLEYGVNLLQVYLQRLEPGKAVAELVCERQQFYCDQQRSNQKTLQVLERMIGYEQARYFIDHVLFPDPRP